MMYLVQGEEEQEHYVKDATDKGSKVLHTILSNGTELVTNIRLAAQNLQVHTFLRWYELPNKTYSKKKFGCIEKENVFQHIFFFGGGGDQNP